MNAQYHLGSILGLAKYLIRGITMRRSCLFLAFLWIFATGSSAQAQTLAFPGAEGFGRFAKGGRGGRVIEVTNLNESGSGSLREALEASGARTVVFRVSGTIEVNDRIRISNPSITIAGQTAPGEGVTVKGMLDVRTHDVIIRYLRVRPDVIPTSSDGGDAIQRQSHLEG